MTPTRRAAIVLALACLVPAALPASPASDFAARAAQTVWSLQQVEALIRAMPQSSREAAPPEAVSSYLALASENVHALSAVALEKVTDEQRRVMSEALKGIASLLRDESVLASNRGLAPTSAGLSSLETVCRGALAGF
jgi:hypothetical protein